MEFSPRGFQRGATPAASTGHAGASAPQDSGNHPVRRKAMQKIRDSKSLTALWVVFFGSITVLVLALIFSISTKSNEAGLIEKDQYQAVFLNNGQAYFGKVKTMNNSFVDLRDVYYLYNGSANTQDQSAANLSLVKLGTELHCPTDQMVIYRDQISFWENLNTDGKVATAIKQWKEENKDGVKCSTATQQTTQQSTSPQQTTENTTNTTPTTNTDNSSNTNNSTSDDTDTSTSNNNSSSSNQQP